MRLYFIAGNQLRRSYYTPFWGFCCPFTWRLTCRKSFEPLFGSGRRADPAPIQYWNPSRRIYFLDQTRFGYEVYLRRWQVCPHWSTENSPLLCHYNVAIFILVLANFLAITRKIWLRNQLTSFTICRTMRLFWRATKHVSWQLDILYMLHDARTIKSIIGNVLKEMICTLAFTVY